MSMWASLQSLNLTSCLGLAMSLQAMNALSTQRANYPDSFNRDEHNFDYMSEFSGKDELIKAWLSDSIDQDSQ